MAKGFRLAQQHRRKLQQLVRRRTTVREIAELLGYPESNIMLVHRALNPAHTFHRDTLAELEERIEQLQVAS